MRYLGKLKVIKIRHPEPATYRGHVQSPYCHHKIANNVIICPSQILSITVIIKKEEHDVHRHNKLLLTTDNNLELIIASIFGLCLKCVELLSLGTGHKSDK